VFNRDGHPNSGIAEMSAVERQWATYCAFAVESVAYPLDAG